ncbi:MAG: biotin--[acetyl-CoA-carboxylase] ligase [Bradyrhizobium sp.]|nr:MAG: biotin--[acetyl-CoA-carboxylase] ligase [Bradyrhizobium sp.]
MEPEPFIAGWRIARLDRVGSTNDEARTLGIAGDPGRLWVVAKEQTRGRGRKGRFWSSPPGNLYASALIVDPGPPALAPQLGFVAGVALAQAVEDLGGREFALKWPNDLLWRGAKVAGLLAESVTTKDRRLACVIGVGVNCRSAPDGVAYPVAALGQALERDVGPEALLLRLARRFHEALGLWARGAGFAEIRALWLAVAAGVGEPIRVSDPRGARKGLFEGLDASGRLLLRTPLGVEAIEAADLHLLSPAGPDAPAGDERT